MCTTPPRQATTNTRPALPPRPNRDRLLQTIHDAVINEHLGVALSILSDNPVLRLPDHLAQKFAAKLRQRGQYEHLKQVSHHASPSQGIMDLLSIDQRDTRLNVEPSEFRTRLFRLARNGRLNECFSLIESSPSETLDTEVLEAFLKAAARSAHVSHSHYILHVLFPKYNLAPSAIAFSCFVDACGRAGNMRRALGTLSDPDFVRLPKVDQTLIYEKVVDACVRCRAARKAQVLLRRMIQRSIPRTQKIFDCLLSASRTKGNPRQVEEGLAIISQMRRDGFSAQSISTYNALIRGAGRAGKFTEAMNVYSALCESSIKPNRDTYNALLSSFARAAQPDKALRTLRSMREEHLITPNAISYNWVVNACARSGDVDRAFEVANTMKEEGIRLNVVTYNNLLKACCKAGHLERAFGLVKDMIQKEGIQPNSHTYDTLIQGCGRWGELDAALRLFYSMRAAGIAPTIITYSVAIDACAKCDATVAVDQAFELMMEMKRSGLEPNLVTYNSLIHTCARAKRADLAFKALQFMREDRVLPDIITLCSLVDACGRIGDVSRAFEIFEQLPREFPSIKPNVPVYNALIHACFKADDFERMEIALDALHRKGLQPNIVTYSTLISAYATKGRVEEVARFLNKMEESGMCPNKLTITSVISGYGRSGHVAQAMEMLEKARRVYGKPDEELYTAAIVAAIGGDRKETALKLAREMSRAGYCVPSVLNKMIRKTDDSERNGAELRRMLSAMEALNVRPQRVALETIVKAYAEEGDPVSAFGVLPDMQRLGYPPSHQTYRSLIHACMLSKDPTHIRRARALFRRVRASVEDGHECLRSYRWRDLYDAVVRAIDKVSDPTERIRLLRGMLESMAKDCGKVYASSLAERVCPEILNDLSFS